MDATTTTEDEAEEKSNASLRDIEVVEESKDTTVSIIKSNNSPIPDRLRAWSNNNSGISSPRASGIFSPRKNQVHQSPTPKTAGIKVLSPKNVDNLCCLICMDSFTTSRKAHPIPCLGQCAVDQDVKVHYRCMMAWLSTSNNSCPLCRGECDPTSLLPPSIESLDLDNMETLVTTPISLDAGIVRCYVKQRVKRQPRNWWKPGGTYFYECYMQAPVNNVNNVPDRLMMTAHRALSRRMSSEYSINAVIGGNSECTKVIGQLCSNFIGTTFHLYDDGLDPAQKVVSDLTSLRHELGVVTYEANRASVGPRKMKVGIPSVEEETSNVVSIIPTRPSEKLGARINESESDDIIFYHNREPEFREELGAYCLDFGGRVSMASVKNFQLVSTSDPSTGNVLQFGRIGSDMFTVDFQWPLSPLQAFAISLSSCDTKLACV